MAELATFPRLLQDRAQRFGPRPAMREKYLGIWQTWTWREMNQQIRSFASGLSAMGFKRGDRLVIIGDNRPRLYWGIAAAQCLGGIPVPTYQDAVASEVSYVVEHAGATFVLVEDQEQTDKMLEVQEGYSALTHIIYDDDRGMREYNQTGVVSLDQLLHLGAEHNKAHPNFLDQEIEQGAGEDTAIMLYTSGTTGKPKGVVLTHNNLMFAAKACVDIDDLNENDSVLAYLPMAWVGDNVFSFAQAIWCGYCVNCPEGPETIQADMREIGPTYYFAPPRVFEGLLTNVTIRMEDAAPIKQKMYKYFMEVASGIGGRLLDGETVSGSERFKYWLGNVLVYAPLKDALGLGRVRTAYTAGEAIGPELFQFYRSLGVNLKQVYGQTEATVYVTVQPNGQVRADTVGIPVPGVELKIDDSGEVLYRGDGVFHSYYKNPESTASTKDEDGWVSTGDAGFMTDDGHLRIIDRVKDVGKFESGKLFAPKYIENKLKFFSHVKEAVVFGSGKDKAMAFIDMDMEAVGNWAERNNIAYSSFQELAANEQVYQMVKESIEQVNEGLIDDPLMSHSQVHRFLILPKQLDADDGELTRTLKVRRAHIADKYASLINALYNGDKSHFVELEVKFEDGRTGSVSGTLVIEETRVFEPASTTDKVA